MSDSVSTRGILRGGYGIVAKSVMRDTSLSPEAKAIYAYLCSYSGSDGSCFPSVGRMAYELGMSEQRLKKHRKQLEEAGYITIERRRENGKQTSNLYVIELQPSGFLTPENLTPENLTPENLTPENLTPENMTPTINSSTINSFTINRLTNNSDDEPGRTANKKKPKEQRHKYGEYDNVLLTDSDLSKLKSEFPNDWKQRIDRLSEYMECKGAKYKNHLATIRSWARKDSSTAQAQAQAQAAPKWEPVRHEDFEERQRREEQRLQEFRDLKRRGMVSG
jgi:hypothetical protein